MGFSSQNDKKQNMEYIYIIKELGRGFLKIGMSKDPKKRLGDLQVGIPHSLILVHSRESSMASTHERNVHKKLEAHLIRGEWFSCDEKLAIRIVNSIADGEGVLTEDCYMVKWNFHGKKSRIVYGRKKARYLKTKHKGSLYRCDSEGNRLNKRGVKAAKEFQQFKLNATISGS